MRKILYILCVGILLCTASCEPAEIAPQLGSIVFDEITDTSIEFHVEVKGGSVDDAAFYYGTVKYNVASDKAQKVDATYTQSVIRGEILGLSALTEYYIKVYGMNELGRGETEVVKVKTLARTPAADDNKHPDPQP